MVEKSHQLDLNPRTFTYKCLKPLSRSSNRQLASLASSVLFETITCTNDSKLLGADQRESSASYWGRIHYLSKMLYGVESWPVDAQMTKFIILFGTSARRIITGVKRLDKAHNSRVLAAVSRNELIHMLYDHQLRFLGHMLRVTYSLHARTYALYQPTHGSTPRCGRPGTNYMDYIRSEKQ